MNYTVIALAGRQFIVNEGDILRVTHQSEPSAKVLFYKSESQVKVGTPYLDDITVDLEKLEDKKDKKVVVARFRAKSRHRRKIGHRQEISVLKVKSISEGVKVTKKSTKVATKAEVKTEVMSEEDKG